MVVWCGGDSGGVGAGDGVKHDYGRVAEVFCGVVGGLQRRCAGGDDDVHFFIYVLLGDGAEGGNVPFGVTF